MNTIKKHIKNNDFKPYYLLYGNEPYLKNLYKNLLRNAIVDQDDEMNFTRYDGKDIDLGDVIALAQTLPFFKDKRLILIENSSLFNEANEFSESILDIPETTIIIFIENDIDKRLKLYKLIKKHGYVLELNNLDVNNLKIFIAKTLKQNNKKITEQNAMYLIDRIGSDMESISNEIKKLVSYVDERDAITKEDIDLLVTVNITNRIFEMIDAMAFKQQNKTVELYYDLIKLREKPMRILYLINRQFNILLQIKELSRLGFQNTEISKRIGIPPFAVSKNLRQSNKFTVDKLRSYLEYTIQMEADIKTGLIQESIGLDLLVVKLSS
ncbi:MAG TPA: DNA polymerase III subunit delta [Clostridiales bacterium]|nr:DNA polymerase III subunit delta [Clostridiales bacterium]